MKPYKIFLVRHGESVGNVDKSVYAHTPDWKVTLTDKGKEQAELTAEKIYQKLALDMYNIARVNIYCSPWIRARQTSLPFMEKMKHHDILYHKYFEDPRLREQDWGNYQEPLVTASFKRERNKYGPFFYRFPNGESGADVYDRISTFLETLHRDFEKEEAPNNVVIFTHGCTMRIFLMRWFHWTVEEYEQLKNPPNGHVYVMEKNNYDEKYTIKNIIKRTTVV